MNTRLPGNMQDKCHVQHGAKNSCMFEIPAFLPPSNLGLPMHSPLALTEHVSLNLKQDFFARSCKGPVMSHDRRPQNFLDFLTPPS